MRDRPTLHDRLSYRLLYWAAQYAVKYSRHLATFHLRPKRTGLIGTHPEPGASGEACAIFLQGPVAQEDDFTLETFRLYRRHFPHCPLILSTWRDTPDSLLAPIRDLGVQVVLSDKPAQAGLFNVNMQLTSAAAGVRAAASTGAPWTLKSRTDQRLYHPDAIAYLVALAKSFPPAAGFNQKCRIVGVGQGSLKFAPYHVTDQTVFGHTEDMLTYWTPPLREDPAPAGWPSRQQDIFVGTPIGELCRHAAAESYITSQFLERLGRPLDWTLQDTWAAYRDHFCFADFAATDFYWVKGQTYSLREFVTVYDMTTNRHEFSFREWLLMQTGALRAEDARRYEHVLTERFNQPVSPIESPAP